MIAIVMILSIVGNGIICLLLIRFKTLRTVPNILIANLAAVNILNALTNMPLFILWYICKVPFLKGRLISWILVTWYVLFVYLTVFNLTAQAMDRFGAIVHGLHYYAWKTKKKAKVAVLFVWLLAYIWYVYTWIGYWFRRRSSAGIQDDLLENFRETLHHPWNFGSILFNAHFGSGHLG